MFGAKKLSRESALAMQTVTEERPDGDASREEGLSTTGTLTQNHGDSSSSSFSLARQETQMLIYSRRALLLVVLVLAITMGCITYKITHDHETENFENKFRAVAGELSEAIKHKVHETFESLERLSTEITTDTVEDGTVWPFVRVHNFQVKGLLSNEDVGANTLSLVPLFHEKDLENWGIFSVQESTWIEDGHNVDAVIAEDIFDREYFEYREEQEQEPDGAPWYEEGITPFVWKYADGAIQDADHGNQERERVEECYTYAPIWQTAPAPDFSSLVNLDLHSLQGTDNDVGIARFIDAMVQVGDGVITEVVDHHHLIRQYDHRFPPEDMVEPHSYVFQPIFDTLMAGNRTIVAFLASFISWGAFLTDIVSTDEEGIVIILTNNCDQAYTYELFGKNADFYGYGDLHAVDSVSYDGLHWIKAVSEDLVEHFHVPVFHDLDNATEYDSRSDKYSICQFEISVYPDYEFRGGFFTNMPIAYAASVVACFVITTMCFLAYDALVQRRQKLVMDQAKKTTAIVNSLFPENVRERLLDEVQEEGKAETNKTAFLAHKIRKGPVQPEAMSSESIYGSKPIADLFPETTIMFADIVGFTAWSSIREPAQVFSLLESIYHSFDVIAARRRIFKVETIGDCYVAVTGLPYPREDHAVAMAKFSCDCLQQMKDVVNSLDKTLGPGTSELNMRFGLHSGQVTAGVLRGEKGRFQLFGDSMNVASRMESTSLAGRVQISSATADILIAKKRDKWVTPRKEVVMAKGLGTMQTYWLRVHAESECTGSRMTSTSHDSADRELKLARETQKGLILLNQAKMSDGTAMGALPSKVQRMVEWNVDVMIKLLQKIMARRASSGSVKPMKKKEAKKLIAADSTVLDEVQDILALPHFDAKVFKNLVDPEKIKIPDEVVKQLTDYLAKVAGLYRDNPFHNFDHASHVTMSISKLLSRIISPIEVSTKQRSNDEIAENLHDHTFGITSDPLTQFACILSGLIHDADHPGVPNSTLVKEEDPLAAKYKGKSVAEQNSVDLAWSILMKDEYKGLRDCIYGSKEEFDRFRSIIVNVVMATDIMDKELGAKRRQRWDKAFSEEASKEDGDNQITINRKATIVLEHLMQASDVAHTMQHWTVYRKFNERLFRELYKAYKDGRSEVDPSKGWFQGELGFFDYYIIPLAKKLDMCGVFGVSSQEYLNYAITNRHEWNEKGNRMVQEYMERWKADFEEDEDDLSEE